MVVLGRLTGHEWAKKKTSPVLLTELQAINNGVIFGALVLAHKIRILPFKSPVVEAMSFLQGLG